MRLIRAIALIAILGCIGLSAHAELYPTVFLVDSVDEDSWVMTLVDPEGFLWEAEVEDEWWVGDVVAAIMDDAGTNEVFDDEIISLRYVCSLD